MKQVYTFPYKERTLDVTVSDVTLNAILEVVEPEDVENEVLRIYNLIIENMSSMEHVNSIHFEMKTEDIRKLLH